MVVLLLILFLTQTPAATSDSPKLVNENNANARWKDGTLELRGGSGWLRTEHPMLDFEVRFDIRALTPDSDPGLIIRTWTGQRRWPQRGYRLGLPVATSMDPSELLTGYEQRLKVLTKGALSLRPYGEWQSVHVVGERGLIRVSVNDVLAAEIAIESPGGYLMFDNRKGRVEIRQITLQTRELNEPIPSDIVSDEELKKSGGKSPEIQYETQPAYTPEAQRRRVQGTVEMQAVVLADGTVGPVRVTRSRDTDLDVAAVAALKAWRFRPALLNGSPVPSLVLIEMSFATK